MTRIPERVVARWGTVRFRYRLLASLTGYAITAFVAWYVLFHLPGWAGRDVDVWIRAGASVRGGLSPYGGGALASSFYYAPPWALLLGATTWVGKPILWVLIAVLEVLSLRYIAGSWLRAGYFGLCFLTGAEIVSGAFNLVVAAGLAAAVRGDSRLAAFMALAKLSPALAIREWRRPAIVLGACLLLTMPVLGWWGDWVGTLTRASGAYTAEVGFHELPLVARLVVALVILALWRSPRAGALAAAVAIPGLYAISVVLLFALAARPKEETAMRAVAEPLRRPMLIGLLRGAPRGAQGSGPTQTRPVGAAPSG
jgi:hypothetical protein